MFLERDPGTNDSEKHILIYQVTKVGNETNHVRAISYNKTSHPDDPNNITILIIKSSSVSVMFVLYLTLR